MSDSDITLDRVRQLLNYSPETGKFTWAVSRKKVRLGAIAGSLDGKGYLAICVDGHKHLAHRLAWLMSYGRWPVGQLDHKNRVKTDNRLGNLREATNLLNSRNKNLQANNASGVPGVCWDSERKNWRVEIAVCGKRIRLGRFNSLEVARLARQQAEVKYWV